MDDSPTISVFHSSLPLREKLERVRTELLDLTARNRLLNIPRSSRSVSTLEIVDEKSSEIFRLLVRENRTFTFVPGRSAGVEDPDSDEVSVLAQPEDDVLDDRGVPRRHSDTKLQTRLTSKGLQKRLFELHSDAKTLEEEQGVNILFLGLGTLRWIDPLNAKNIRHAPLILIPVSLERSSAAERFRLKCRPEDQATNLSLEAFLDRVHGLKLPDVEVDEDFDLAAYMAAVAETISSKQDWRVQPDDIVLGFFSFAKFLMYRDLDPAGWPADANLADKQLIRSLLTDGFLQQDENLISESAAVDACISPSQMIHVVDSDSSQTLATENARRGNNLVIQGPPGTGKSQVIANIIASAIADGKTVLFVAEKMAALEVVKRRLDNAQVGDACLELHSNRASKRVVLDELRRTWQLGSPRGDPPDSLSERLEQSRDKLNEHVARIHTRHEPSKTTPYAVAGELVRLRRAGSAPSEFPLRHPEQWSPAECKERRQLLMELAQRVAGLGSLADHPWRGVNLPSVLPMQVDRFIARVTTLNDWADRAAKAETQLCERIETDRPARIREFDSVLGRARRIGSAPRQLGAALGAPDWETSRSEIRTILQDGMIHAKLSKDLADDLNRVAWTTPVNGQRAVFASLAQGFDVESLKLLRTLPRRLDELETSAQQLLKTLAIDYDLNSVAAAGRLIEIGQLVASAPPANPEALAAAVWTSGVERASVLVEAVATAEDVRAGVSAQLRDEAWKEDLETARQTILKRSGDKLRLFSSEWRRATRQVKPFLRNPKAAWDQTAVLLETLAQGQRALAVIRENDAFGCDAFGDHWQGDRSTAAPLRALVAWIQELGPWAEEIREVASRASRAKPEIARLVTSAREKFENVLGDIDSLRKSLPDRDLSEEPLDSLREFCRAMSRAEDEWITISAKPVIGISERLRILDLLIEGQRAANSLAGSESLALAAFGPVWLGAASDWAALMNAADWIDANPDIRLVALRCAPQEEVVRDAEALSIDLRELCDATKALFDDLALDCEDVFRSRDTGSLGLHRLLNHLAQWKTHPEELSKWVTYRGRANEARRLGLESFVDAIERQVLLPELTIVERAFEQAYYEALFEEHVRSKPSLAHFDGDLHTGLAGAFADLDRERIKSARLEVIRAHHRRIPTYGGVGPVGILLGEINKRRGHMPLRQLMAKASAAVQAIKPVMMMSPLSVAQFLPPGQVSFDLLVMDEASQIQPVDALGAVARCKQVVVVGDERQLPPTRFFSKLTGASSEEDDDITQVADSESILGLFTARGLPKRMLRWHYRSRHQSLIAVSNSQFYENKLFIVPSPFTQEAGLGLQFKHVSGGTYDSGESRTNQVEALAVAEAVIRHAKEHPHFSLGVATFSVVQRRAIQDQLEKLRRDHPAAEAFFQAHAHEPFFVKNLENIQGDERDVVFISVGYAKNSSGYMAMSFGPLSAEGGERRLNVLISRAKRRCVVFASITDEDIDTERGKGRGVFAFKTFLHYARTGNLSLAITTGKGHDSVFEVQVANALQERGYQVHAQVGIAGFFIDLAIGDPAHPGRYVLGIECDGASYHSAQSARDRDRLRQSVLEDHGWIIHRIWSLDWFQRPAEQLKRTIAAIESAKRELDARETFIPPPPEETFEDADTIVLTMSSREPLSVPYLEARLTAPAGLELHEAPSSELASLITKVVAVEGPIHEDELTTRIRSAWGLQRSGARIQAKLDQAIAFAVQFSGIARRGKFLSNAAGPIIPRDRTSVSSITLRKPDMLPPEEVEAAILAVVKASLGAHEVEIAPAVSRLLGFKATSAQLREVIEGSLAELLKQEVLQKSGEILICHDGPIDRKHHLS